MERQILDGLGDCLRHIPPMRDMHESLIKAGPASGSPAAIEVARPAGNNVWTLANQAWANASEHLLVWGHLLFDAEIHPRNAHATLLRSGLEGAVTARWLVDPKANGDERIARAVGLLLEDFDQRRKFENAVGAMAPTHGGMLAVGRIDELKQEAAAAGIVPGRVPTMVERFDVYSEGNWLYRLLSAYAHGFQWSLLGSTLSESVPSAGVPDTTAMKVTADGPFSLAATIWAVEGLSKALAELHAYAGR